MEHRLPFLTISAYPEELNLHQLCSKNECDATQREVGWPTKSALAFPKTLVLGPEQIKAINCKRRVVLLLGEAGCGKTTVLLALLFKFAGKHVEDENKKKVVFFIPPHKTTFRGDILSFVNQFCVWEWVDIVIGLDEKKVGLNNGATIYLFDEIYDTGLLSRNFDKGKIYAVLIPGEKLIYQTGFFNFQRLDVEIIYF